jgi:hypothetical protein
VLTAGQDRPDIAGAFPGAGAAHGFSLSTTVPAGAHQVCVYAIDVEVSSRFTALGCRAISTQVTPPIGNFEGLSASGSTVSLQGWALDPDSRSVSSAVHVYVDGRLSVLTAGQDRPDIAGAFPGAGAAHGFSLSTTVPAGAHQVCVYAIDVDISWQYTSLGCRAVRTAG